MTSVPYLFGNNLLSLANARMVYSERRTAVLAQDIANADTPGFVARDLPDFASLLQGMRLAPAGGGASLQQPDALPRGAACRRRQRRTATPSMSSRLSRASRTPTPRSASPARSTANT